MKGIKAAAVAVVVLFAGYKAATKYWAHLMETNNNLDQAPRQIACATESPLTKKVEFDSMTHPMKATYVEAGAADCITPHFPIVYFESLSGTRPNAWIHVIHSKNIAYFKGEPYVDSAPQLKGLYPFYTRQEYMTDAPSMGYDLLRTETLDWVGHAYAVTLGKDDEITGVLGGIRWGYLVKPLALRPVAITPTPLTKADWEKDLATFNAVLQKAKRDGTTLHSPAT